VDGAAETRECRGKWCRWKYEENISSAGGREGLSLGGGRSRKSGLGKIRLWREMERLGATGGGLRGEL